MVVSLPIPYPTSSSHFTRRFEERKPLDPSYSTVQISQAESTDPDREVKDFEKLLHAPPGYARTLFALEYC